MNYRVTIKGSDTVLLFSDLSGAHAEWAARCAEGQRAMLWQLRPETAQHDAGWEPQLCWLDYDDVRGEVSRLGYNPWPSEDSDREKFLGIDP